MNKRHLIILLITASWSALAQQTIHLKQGDKMVSRMEPNGEKAIWVVGNVIFKQNETTIYCDSAKQNKKENSFEAFGRIRITDGDSVTVTSLALTYDGNRRIAHLRKNVVFTKLNTATLYTNYLDFDRVANKAFYHNGGKLVDSTNTLTSQKGYYNINTNMASFKKDVVGVSEDKTLTSDTLQYQTKTKIIYFRDKTVVQDAEGKTSTYSSGFYNTLTKLSNLNNGEIETGTYHIKGDKYFLDDKNFFYRATGNVTMKSKEQNLIIYGDQGDYYKDKGISKVYGHCYLTSVGDAMDTLFLSADTLVSIENIDPRLKKLLAYHHVKIYKPDMQAIADSLVYATADSMMYFYNNPILWNQDNQMSADTINILLRENTVDKIFMINNSFVASLDSLENFNQIKGREMVAIFKSKKIHHVDVNGNGQSIYFALEEKEVKDSTMTAKITFLTGMNKIDCSNMKINFVDAKINNITFLKNPDASFIPPTELKEKDLRLKGFTWRAGDKPTRDAVVNPDKLKEYKKPSPKALNN